MQESKSHHRKRSGRVHVNGHLGPLSGLDSAVLVCGPDRRITRSNRAARQLLGNVLHGDAAATIWRSDACFVRDDGSAMPPAEFPLDRAFREKTPVTNVTVGIKRERSFGTTWTTANAYPDLGPKGRVNGVILTLKEQTDEVNWLNGMNQDETSLRFILNALPESILILNGNGVITAVNDRWTRLIQHDHHDAAPIDPVGLDYGKLCHAVADPRQRERVLGHWHGIEAVLGGKLKRFGCEYSSGQSTKRKWFRMRALPLGPRPGSGVVILHEEITKRKRLEQSLRQLATIDDMTKLPNRRHFLSELEAEHARIRRGAIPCTSVLMIDVDRFKKINDRYGHDAGDQTLRHIARLFRESIRSVDGAGRLGGEEFAIYLSGADSETATAVAERLRRRIEASPAIHDGKSIDVTISIGLNEISLTTSTIDDALKGADAALYRAKNAGRNRVVVEPH